METNKSIQFFDNLMNPTKEIRTQAEKDLETLKTKTFEESFPIFQEGIKSENQRISQLATLLLKKVFLDNNEVKEKLTENQIEAMKSFIRSQITFEKKEWKTLQRLGETLALLYQISDIKKSFGEIMELFNKQEFLARKLSMFIISNLSDLGTINDEMAKSNSNDFKTIFAKCFEDQNDTVKISAISAFNKFIVNLKDEKVQELFADMINPLFINILNLFKNNLEVDKIIFDSLIFLVDSYPKFFKNNIDLIIESVCKISSEQKISYSLRQSSLEIVYSLANSIPGKIRSSKNFQDLFIPLLFKLLLEIDNINSLDVWEKLKEEDENDMEFMFYAVKTGLERLSIDLGGEFFFQSINSSIKAYLSSKNWVEIHGGFAALAYISEGAKDIYSKNLKELLQFISEGLVHEHPRVRYMALVFFGNLLTETAPKPQKEYTNNILPGIAKLLTDNEKSLRVKATACLALNDFLAGLISKNKNVENNIIILSPYINDLISLIMNVFENSLNISYEPLQAKSLECISLLSNIHEKNFSPYYSKIMPGLKKLYFGLDAKTEQQKQLKTNCISTIGYLFSGINEEYEKYKQDFKDISEAFVNSLDTLPEEDPQIVAIIEAFISISYGMSYSDFEPIFKKLFSYLSKYISADIGLTLKDADVDEYIPDEEEKKEGVGSVVFNYGVKSKKISVNTFALQLKIVSFESLNEMALNLGESFKPYVEQYLELAKKLLSFAFSRKIRKTAIKCIYTCTNACSKDDERKKVFELVINDLLSLLEFDITSKFFKDMKCIIKYIGKSINLYEHTINIDLKIIEKIFETLKEIVGVTQNKINEIYNLFKNDDDGIYDANDKSDQNTDIFQLQKIYKYINILYNGLYKFYEQELTPLVKKYLAEFFFELWGVEINTILNNPEEMKSKMNTKHAHQNGIAMCIQFFNVFMEYCDMDTFHTLADKYYINSQKIEDSEIILSNVIEGYGIICEREDKKIFSEKYKNIIVFIQKILQRSKTDETLSTYDKAIRSLGRYIYYQCNEDDYGYNLAKEFVKLLPAINDLDESDRICSEFFDQINDVQNKLFLDERNKDDAKQAVQRIIELNQTEQFIDDVTKLIPAAMNLGLQFNNLVD